MADARQAGFTLIEMIVCLALAALIGLLLVNTVRIAGTASSAVARAVDAEDLQAVRDHLRRTFGSLAKNGADTARPALRGRSDGLSAVIGSDPSLERFTELAVALRSAQRADGGLDLVESRAALDTAPGLGSETRTDVLLEGVASLAIRYFWPAADRARRAWHAAGLRPDRPPSLMEIAILIAPQDRRRWPPLVIALGDRP